VLQLGRTTLLVTAQNGGSRAATLDIRAGTELSVVCIVLCRGHQCGMSIYMKRQPLFWLMYRYLL
jgi:hypothetical protein